MLIRPSPRRFIASCQSNPIPESLTVKLIPSCRAVHFHCEVLISAMLYSILQCFLKDSKQAKRDFLWELSPVYPNA